MLGIHDFWLYLIAGLVLIMTPGPDTLYIVGRSVAQGRRAGMLSALGISTGSLIHTTFAALGLSVLLARSATAFTVVRWVGAAYLIYLGLRMLFAARKTAPGELSRPAAANLWTIYRQAITTNILNPKVALFFLAFLPQFVEPDAPHRTLALLLLGVVFVLNGTFWCLGIAWFAATVSRRFRERQSASVWLSRAAGVLFVGLGVRVARS
jgi:RhtB (resistance to homoserine/threonine) family protein